MADIQHQKQCHNFSILPALIKIVYDVSILISKGCGMGLNTTLSVIIFIGVVAVLGICGFILIMVKSFPSEKAIKRRYIGIADDVEIANYYFFYEKAVSYRGLFRVYLTYHYLVRILGVTATMVTVYCAFANADFLLVAALIAAICDIFILAIPLNELSKKFLDGNIRLESMLLGDKNCEKPELYKTYSEAARMIYEDYY
jgi:hypothetical protein